MSDVFVSYAREDLPRVAPLVALLEGQGFSVWWDRSLHPGDGFEDAIDKQILEARCVVVAWSHASVSSTWVRNEALEGMERGILVPVMFDDVRVPVAFRQIQGANFQGYPQRVDAMEVDGLLEAVGERLGTKPKPQQPYTSSHAHGQYSPAPKARGWPGRVQLLVAAAVVAVGALLAWQLDTPTPTESRGTALAATQPRIAVARLQHGSTTEEAFFANSLTFELNRHLHDTDAIQGVPPGRVWDWPETSPQELMRLQRLDHLLTGRVERQDEATLVLHMAAWTANAEQRWTRTIQAGPGDVTRLVAELFRELVTGVIPAAQASAAGPEQLRSTDPQAYTAYLKALDHLRRRRPDDLQAAERALRTAIDRDPRFVAAHIALCRVMLTRYRETLDTEDFEGAERSCHRSMTLGANGSAAALAIGQLYRTSGQLQRALEQFHRSLALDGRQTEAYLGLSGIARALQDPQSAERHLRTALEIEPTWWLLHNVLGSHLLRQGRFNAAAEAFQHAAMLAPSVASPYNNLGVARLFNGEFEAALDAWGTAGELQDTPAGYANTGTALYFLGRYAEAADHYRLAINGAPNDHRLWGNLAEALGQLPGEQDAAHAAWETAARLASDNLAVNPEHAATLSRLAIYQAAKGERAAATMTLERVASDTVADSNLLYDLTLAHALLGDTEQARTYAFRATAAGYPEALLRADPQLAGISLQASAGSTPPGESP